jgi:folylpolyglutamate synthase/dihydropteroate synthase
VPIRNPRSLAPEAAAAKAARFRIAAEPCASFSEALPLAEAAAREEDGPVFVCGSLFLVGEALERLADAPPTPFSTNPSARSVP